MGEGFGLIVTSVVQTLLFPHSSTTVHTIVDTPVLKIPLASSPVPFRVVAPVIE
jgi:hypothetical protein